MTEPPSCKLRMICPYCGKFQLLDYFQLPVNHVHSNFPCNNCHKIYFEALS